MHALEFAEREAVAARPVADGSGGCEKFGCGIRTRFGLGQPADLDGHAHANHAFLLLVKSSETRCGVGADRNRRCGKGFHGLEYTEFSDDARPQRMLQRRQQHETPQA